MNLEERTRLRNKAEELLKQSKSESNITNSEADLLKLIHELEVHQIELEMQNEELISAKNKANEASEKYEEIYDFAPSGYFTLSRKGNILKLNILAAKMLGKERLKLINSRFALFVKEDSRIDFHNILEEIFQSKINESCDLSLISYDKKDLYIHLTGNLSDNGEECYIIAIDITERKNNEMLLIDQNRLLENQHNQNMLLNEVLTTTNLDLEIAKVKAEESDKLKTAFLQNMSHEIRTPLNGILGFSSLLQDENIAKNEIKEFTAIIQQSGNRLLEIVNNVLDISKIETGQLTVKNSVFLINSIFSDLLTFFTPLADSKNVELFYHNLDDTKRLIYSDESKLNQIFTNLINNAIKFTTSGRIDYGYEIKEYEIQFYVKDTGIGIPEEYYEKIFDRFIQVDLKITRGYEGAGLGLSICKGLVELLGGNIWLESEVGKGTTFYFTIPLHDDFVNKNIEIKESDNQVKINHGTILIAEDDWTSFHYLGSLLKNSEVTILHAENGKKAVEFVEKMPDLRLVLMDIKMPIMNGIEATKLIKQIRPDLPIIAQTAYAFSSEKEEILSIGCNDYISKPISKEHLLKLIEKYA